MKKVQVQLPPDADEDVAESLRAVAVAIADKGEVTETEDAPANTYGLTVHVFPDKAEA